MSLASFAVKAPVKVSMIFLAVLLLGWISLSRLPTNLFPDIRAPKVTVTVQTEGLSPGEVERRINEVIERQLFSIRGVVAVESVARADTAVVIVDFDWDTNLDYAFLEVKKAASDLQRQRSDEIESVQVLRYDPNAMPVVTAALTAPPDVDLESLFKTAEQSLKPRFERLEGVANVVLSGGMEREIRIDLDQTLLLTYGYDVSDAVNALQSENVDATGGWVEEGTQRYLLKAVGEFESLDDVRSVVIGRQGGSAVTLSDIAEVRYAPKEADSIVYLDGKESVGLDFYREADGNTVAVARLIREELEDSEDVLPESWNLTVANDQSVFISSAIREVRNNALLGGLLAIVVLMLFLRDLRTTVIVAIAIPISIIATFNLMYFQGLTLNLMTLGGLALGTGMLVDNAIVVLENIFRLRQEGETSQEAARIGSKEVGGALIASTLTTVAVFLPIVYVKGVAGLLFKEQALTVAYSLLASLVVALLLIPMLSAYFLGRPPQTRRSTEEELAVPKGFYTATLRLALRLRFLVVLVALGLLFLSYHVAQRLPQEFLPDTEVNQVGIRLVLPSGTPIEGTDRVVESISNQFARYEEAIERVYTRVGQQAGVVNADTEDPDGPNTADMFVTLYDDEPTTAIIEAGLADFSSSDLISGLKPIIERVPDAKVEFQTTQGSMSELIGSSRAPLFIEISGPEIETLSLLAQQARTRLDDVPSLLNVRTNILEGAPEVRVRFDKVQLAKYGLDVNSVANILRQRLDGEVATQIKRESGDVDLRVQVDYGRESLETLENIMFKSPDGGLIRLAAVSNFEISRAPREIVRKHQERVAYVMSDLAGDVKLSQAIADAQEALGGLNLPRRYSMEYTGEEEQRQEAFGNLGFALLLSIALVYMIMASIFESFLQPFLIMITIPLAFVGVVYGLFLTGQTLNVMSIIGVVLLGGIVVNNAIVLLDCVNQVRGSAADAPKALLSERETLMIGCSRRVRPVLMTSVTTMLGLLPMAVGLGAGAELRQAMAITVLAGLLTSTVLTLYVIPCAQSYLDSLRRLARSAFNRLPRRRRALAESGPQGSEAG